MCKGIVSLCIMLFLVSCSSQETKGHFDDCSLIRKDAPQLYKSFKGELIKDNPLDISYKVIDTFAQADKAILVKSKDQKNLFTSLNYEHYTGDDLATALKYFEKLKETVQKEYRDHSIDTVVADSGTVLRSIRVSYSDELNEYFVFVDVHKYLFAYSVTSQFTTKRKRTVFSKEKFESNKQKIAYLEKMANAHFNNSKGKIRNSRGNSREYFVKDTLDNPLSAIIEENHSKEFHETVLTYEYYNGASRSDAEHVYSMAKTLLKDYYNGTAPVVEDTVTGSYSKSILVENSDTSKKNYSGMGLYLYDFGDQYLVMINFATLEKK